MCVDLPISRIQHAHDYHQKESLHIVERGVISYEKSGGCSGRIEIQRSGSGDSSSGFLGPNQVLHRRPAVFDALDMVAPVLGGSSGGHTSFDVVAHGFPPGDKIGGSGGSDDPGATVSGTALTLTHFSFPGLISRIPNYHPSCIVVLWIFYSFLLFC